MERQMTSKLENRVSVLVIVEGAALQKLDTLAGPGNRSAYIRYLIDTVDGAEARKYLELEAQVRVLEKLPKIQAERLGKLEFKIDQLKNVNKQLLTGVSADLGDIPGVLEQVGLFKTWINNLLSRNIVISRGMQLDWIRIRAKDIGVKPESLLDFVQTALQVKGLDLTKLGEI